jgi:Zn-dependent peptidase ImmA (M78 family)
MAEANRISTMLNHVLGPDRFPVKVEELALEYSMQCFPDSPVAKIVGEDLPGFDGLLRSNKDQSKWLIVYNSSVPSPGRKRFTLAHEFGHYLLHRQLQPQFACSQQDMEDWDADEREIEVEADVFASFLLIPLDDFRKQVAGQTISFDLLSHCADRYGVSLTAAALKWIEIADKRAVVVVARDDHLLWARSNQAAFKSGAFFATRKKTIAVPRASLAHSQNCIATSQTESTRAQVWFPREPGTMPLTEMTMVSDQYDYTLTLLLMPDVDWRSPQHADEEAEEDTFDRFIRNGQHPVRK